ncbi:MAG: diacylglycerol kinase family protein [bacterium]
MQLARLPEQKNVAIVLNKNAKSVTAATQRMIKKLHPAADVYISESKEHGTRIAQTIVDRGYRTVATGGGDGTFVQCLSDVYDYLEAKQTGQEPPRFFVLRLGTGNAVASAFGASAPTRYGLAKDLERAKQSVFSRPLPVLSVEGKLSPFAGCGLDAHVLVDYFQSRNMLLKTPFKRLATGGAGYAISVGTRTVPRYLLSALQEIRVRNVGGPAYRVKHQGRFLERIESGELLYEGPAMLATASTIPYTGLNMRLFPYARMRDDKFQFRISRAGVFETLTALPRVWKGTYQSARIYDFLVDRIEVEGDQPLPLQIGGDLAGMRDRIELALSTSQVEMAA